MVKPSTLLVLDEPTVGIDPALRRKVWTELKAIREQGRSILITTHVMSEAEQVDRVALLLGGKVIAFDTPSQLKEQYQVSSIEKGRRNLSHKSQHLYTDYHSPHIEFLEKKT